MQLPNYLYDSDKNECADPDTCGQLCENNLGSYTCKCSAGYQLQSDGKTCESMEIQSMSDYLFFIHLLLNIYFIICGAKQLVTSKNVFLDINECSSDATHDCVSNTYCQDETGSYDCSCPPGLKLKSDARTCTGEYLNFLSSRGGSGGARGPGPPDHQK